MGILDRLRGVLKGNEPAQPEAAQEPAASAEEPPAAPPAAHAGGQPGTAAEPEPPARGPGDGTSSAS